jgi:Rod binding domain-containing protein
MTNITGVTAQTASVPGQTPSNDDARTRSKLVDAAQQFEGMLLQEMLKPLQSKANSWGGENDSKDGSDDASSDTISSFGVEAVAKAISKGGGLGIARQVIRQVAAEHDKMQAEKTAGNISKGGDFHKG